MTSAKPNLTMDVNLHPAVADGRKCYRIDLTGFPDKSGVYLLRFKKKRFARLRGFSSVLKVGLADDGFLNRFKSYNNKKVASSPSFKTISSLRDYHEKSWTEFHFMWFVANARRIDDLVLDFYFSRQSADLERQFILDIMDNHWELPPLNLSMGKKGAI